MWYVVCVCGVCVWCAEYAMCVLCVVCVFVVQCVQSYREKPKLRSQEPIPVPTLPYDLGLVRPSLPRFPHVAIMTVVQMGFRFKILGSTAEAA